MEVREESDKIQYLAARAPGIFKSEESESRCKVPKVPVDVRDEAGYLKTIYPELLEVGEGGEVTERGFVKFFEGEIKGVAET